MLFIFSWGRMLLSAGEITHFVTEHTTWRLDIYYFLFRFWEVWKLNECMLLISYNQVVLIRWSYSSFPRPHQLRRSLSREVPMLPLLKLRSFETGFEAKRSFVWSIAYSILKSNSFILAAFINFWFKEEAKHNLSLCQFKMYQWVMLQSSFQEYNAI